jgi:hypothetical protein
MNSKKIAVMLAVAVVLIGLAHWSSRRRTTSSAAAQRIGQPVFPALQDADAINSVAKLQFVSADGTTEIARSGEQWTATKLHGYPINFSHVREFALLLRDLKIGQVLPVSPVARRAMGLLAPRPDTDAQPAADTQPDEIGTTVILADAQGRRLAEMVVGKDFRIAGGEEDGPMAGMSGARSRGRYVAVGDEVFVVDERFYNLPQSEQDWVDTTLVNVFANDIEKIVVAKPQSDSLRLSRPQGEKEGMTLPGLGEDERMNEAKTRTLVNLWNYLRFDSVADPRLSDEETGFDRPAVFTAQTAKGVLYKLQVGGKVGAGEDRYVRLRAERLPAADEPPTAAVDADGGAADTADEPVAPEPPPADASAQPNEERAKTQAEIEEKNALWSRWTYILPAYQIREALSLTREDLVEKREPKPEAGQAEAQAAQEEDPAQAENP